MIQNPLMTGKKKKMYLSACDTGINNIAISQV